MTTDFSAKLNLAITVLGAIFCLYPLLDLDSETRFPADDSENFKHTNGVPLQRSISLLASFFVILIPAADLILDWPHQIKSFLYPDKRQAMKATFNCHMNEVERLFFMIGVGSQASIWLLPVSADPARLAIVYGCTDTFSAVLILGSILTYLQRCTTTFTARRVSIILFVALAGQVLGTVRQSFRYDIAMYRLISRMGIACIGISSVSFVSTVVLCAYKYIRLNLGSLSTLMSFHRGVPVGPIKKKNYDYDYELFTNIIPALHMTSSLMILAAGYYLNLQRKDTRLTAYERKDYIVLIAEILILVIELRIRKNEVARSLKALLDSKKSYVRYISHELRTPLNTAFLGLKLLGDDLKVSNDPRDKERWETLNDVSLSCAVAVDILNDLLCYEKLESGILELHKENITVDSFMTGCISMITVQAKECGVTMSLQREVAQSSRTSLLCENDVDNDSELISLSLQPTDSIFADKFKMDQVIRNLISNALKFTPRGGKVTIKMYFVYDPAVQEVHRVPTISGKGTGTTVCIDESRRHSSGTLALVPTFRQQRKMSRVGVIDRISPVQDTLLGKLVIVVSDTGVGISKENQARLFKEIIQFNPEKLQAGGGSGLGLWITQEILDLHSGKISVFSEGEGSGTSFTVEMPMYRYPPVQTEHSIGLVGPTLSSRPTASTVAESYDGGDGSSVTAGNISNQTSRTVFDRSLSTLEESSHHKYLLPESSAPVLEILVVDDSRLSRKMLMKCLRAEGHTCFEAEDGLEALEKVKERMSCVPEDMGKLFDIILMDFVMPNMDGPTATREMRALGYMAPIFGVTGNGLPSDVEHFLDCGADKVLLKPLNIDAFTEAMREMKGFSTPPQMHVDGSGTPRWDKNIGSESDWSLSSSRQANDGKKYRSSI